MDLIVEVLSPRNWYMDIMRKIRIYTYKRNKKTEKCMEKDFGT